jgi:ABC-type branched-subunit amino acid transport system ATPase component
MSMPFFRAAPPETPLTAGLPGPWTAILVAVALAAFPLVMNQLEAYFYISLGARVLIMALAASALNLALGYGGMFSLGHAAFLGVGAYTVAYLSYQGVSNVLVTTPAAVAAATLAALLIGAISLRTKGVYFIMITLAFAQLFYYLAMSLPALGGEDGLQLAERPAVAGLKLEGDLAFYYFVLFAAMLAFVLLYRLVSSRFGRALVAIRENERRMAAIGYQITTLFPKLTVLENLALAVQARTGHSFDFLGTVADESDLEEGALEAAGKVGLLDLLDHIVSTLSHGKQRALELGVALACRPKLLLLDEPMAGTDQEESLRMQELIDALRGQHTVILVEHDMDAVFRLADRISVLVAGHVIATGSPEEIRGNPAVIKAYLGDDEGGNE